MDKNKVISRKFQVGDKVICTVGSRFGNTKNREGVVTNILHDRDRNRAKYCVTLQGYNALHGMISPMNIIGYSYEFKLKERKAIVPEYQKCQIGDKVIIKRGRWKELIGKTGNVTSILRKKLDDIKYRVYVKGIGTYVLNRDDFDKVCKFGLNQNVKVIVGYNKGRLGNITKIIPTKYGFENSQCEIKECVYAVTDKHGVYIGNYRENELEIVNEQHNPKNPVVELTLEQAKTMYKAGGSLKTLALSVYSENELNPKRPKDWKEFCELNGFGKFSIIDLIEPEHLCLSRLLLMRKAWVGDWKANWGDPLQKKWIIKTYVNKKGEMLFTVAEAKKTGFHAQLFSFPTEEMAVDFMNCFKNDLVKVERNFQ